MEDGEIKLSDFGCSKMDKEIEENKATRHNEGKPRIGLVPPELMVEVAKVLTFGAKKYDDNNWKKGLPDENCLSSCLRHITSYMAGEEFDSESELPHLAHAACNLGFMLHFHYPIKTK